MLSFHDIIGHQRQLCTRQFWPNEKEHLILTPSSEASRTKTSLHKGSYLFVKRQHYNLAYTFSAKLY